MSLIESVVENFQAATQRIQTNDVVQQHNQEKANLTDEKEELRHQKEALELQKQILKEQLLEANKKILTLEDDLQKRKAATQAASDLTEVSLAPSSSLSADEVSQLQNQLETLLPEYEDLQSKFDSMKEKHENLEKEHETIICNLKESEAKCVAFGETVRGLIEKETTLNQRVKECEEQLEQQKAATSLATEMSKDQEDAYRQSTEDLNNKITQLEGENQKLQENVIKNHIGLERATAKATALELQISKMREESKKKNKDSKSLRKVCAALQLRLKTSDEQLKKVKLELDEEKNAATDLGLRIVEIERKNRSMEMEHEEMRKDCQNWEKLYLEAKQSREKMKVEVGDWQLERDKEVFNLLNRIVTIKDTLDNMKIEIVRHQTPGLKDLERLELCQRNIQLLEPEIRKTQQTPSKTNDTLFAEIAKVTTSLLMQLANHQQLINRFLARALGAKPVRRPVRGRAGMMRGRGRPI